MRRKEIDWIRNICVLMLFIYHTSVIFAYFGDWYVRSKSKSVLCSFFILITFPWYMPMLFFLAGASTKFALDSRGYKGYIVERFKRLLLPLVFGVLVLIPPQTYFARLWRGERNLDYFNHFKYFFSNLGDFSGYDGKFTPAHLWFILYLFIISLLGIAVIKGLRSNVGNKVIAKIDEKLLGKTSPWWLLLFMFIGDTIPLAPDGKSLPSSLLVFILGYIVYSNKAYLDKIELYKEKALIWNVIMITFGIYYFTNFKSLNLGLIGGILEALLREGIMIASLIAIIGYGNKYLNKDSKTLKYLNKACFPVYIIHQSVIVIVGYYVLNLALPMMVSILLIIVISVIITFSVYEIFRRSKVISFFMGIK